MNYFNTMQHIVVFFLKENSFLLMELLLAGCRGRNTHVGHGYGIEMCVRKKAATSIEIAALQFRGLLSGHMYRIS